MNVSRYPKFNDHPYTQRPVLAAYSGTPFGELIWLAIPVIAFLLCLLFR
ncbi:MAG: hypothetical protein HYZ49_05930 [Chloroflexi bacterium]|nr:hypothetical protein [Chloroflexota bacterium]